MSAGKTIIVTDTGFQADDWAATGGEAFATPECSNATALALPADTDPGQLAEIAGRTGLAMIRVDFDGYADGRGFTLARLLRLAGYQGRLRARGPIIADQYAMARRSGFDEVEISEEMAARQPEAQWQFRANWQAHDYQGRLRGIRAQ